MTRKMDLLADPPSQGKLVLDLQQLGFSAYEARTYVSLLESGPTTAYEVSKNSGLPRANTYGALESLANKGAVQQISESPVRYAPADPDILVTHVSRKMSGLCERLRRGLANVRAKPHSDVVWTVTGQRDLTEKIDDLIAAAQDHVWIKASSEVLRAHLAPLREAVARGVSLLLIVFGSDTEEFQLGKNCRVYLHEGTGVRIGGADNLFTIAIDYNVALTASLSGDMVGAYTRSEPVVRMAETLIRHDYYMAEIFREFGEEIERRFGKYLIHLRRDTFSADQVRILESNLMQREADIGPVPEAKPPRHGARPAAAAAKRGPKRRRK
jgi:sugar-specific transcriptional regulator TrmB